MDVFEVLTPGETRMKSTWHGVNSHGASEWFERPTGRMQKAAVVMNARTGSASIVLLDASVDFGSTVTAQQVSAWLGKGNPVTQANLPAMGTRS